MRTPLLAAVLGLSLVGCLTIGDEGTPGTGGDDGTGPGPGSNPGPTLMPRVDVTLDKATVATELGKDEVIRLTLASVDAFAGNVGIETSLVDSTGAAISGGITLVGQPTASLTANGTAVAMYTVKIPSNATGADLGATLKFNVTTPAGVKALSSAITIAPVYTLTYAAGLGGTLAAHPAQKQNIAVKQGAKIRYHNADAMVHITHGDGAFPHETTSGTGGLANGTYEVTTSGAAVGATGRLGCHSHGDQTYATYTIE